MKELLITYDVTWSRKDRYCQNQYLKEQPEEFPTSPVKTRIAQLPEPAEDTAFRKFDFDEEELP